MAETVNQLDLEAQEDERRWFGEPVYVFAGSLRDTAMKIPRFERRPFGFPLPELARPQLNNATCNAFLPTGENRLNDMIVRMPLNEEEAETPVGIVSKQYTLVQHSDLFQRVCDALSEAAVDLKRASAELMLSAYGSKMALNLTLPREFDFDPGDGHVLSLSLYCVNSVDGRCRLRIMLGWFRFICGNGLVIGTARLSQRFIHNEYLELPALTPIFAESLKSVEQERKSIKEWLEKPVKPDRLHIWTDGQLREAWGPLAAARVNLICETGHDGHFAKPGESAPPHRKTMTRTGRVPGAPETAKNAYDVAQALAWVARGRREIQDQVEGMIAIPDLIGALLS
jgi:hypothetical protein